MKIKLKQIIEKEIYLDGILKSNLDIGLKQLHKDWDQVWFIDGAEGSGKSVLGITCAYYVSPAKRRHNLIERICLKIEDAPEIIKNAQPFDSIVIDEAYGGMASSGHAIRLNRMLQRLFTEIRAKNLFLFVIAPTFMDVNRYFAIWRSKCLLHVYSDSGERGYCSFFNDDKKKRLYILGRRAFYNYAVVKPNFRFRFTNKSRHCIDWEKYKEMKRLKNLDVPKEEEEVLPAQMVKCWTKVLVNLNKSKKPLTLVQKREILEMSRGQIDYYTKLSKKKHPQAGRINNTIL